MQPTQFTLEELNETNIQHVPKLMMDVFKKKVSVHSIKTKYDTRYTGVKSVGVLALDHNRKPVAFQGFVACRFRQGAIEEVGVQSCDSLVLKEYRGHNLYAQMLKFGMNCAAKNGATFGYGFANQNSHPIVLKEGWLPRYEMKRFIIQTGALPLARVAKNLNVSKIYQRYTSRFFKPLVTTNSKQFENYELETLSPVYNDEYLNYKKSSNAHLIQIQTSILFVKVDVHLHIGLLKCPTEAELKNVVSLLIKISKKAGIEKILFQLNPNSLEANLMSKIFSSAKSWTVFTLQDHSSLSLDKISLNHVDLDSF